MARLLRAMVLAGILGLGATARTASAVRPDLPIEVEPISDLTATVDDPIAGLQKRIDSGDLSLAFDPKRGYLPAVLDALKVPVSSQVLVFSKTSFQHAKIGRTRPRGVYFGDDVYVGWVRGGDVLEVSAVDPNQGAVFYLLDQDAVGKPAFRRQTHECLQCHVSSRTQGVPGHLVRSVVPDRTGSPIFSAGSYVTGHESPLEQRWGGWYVTGTHGRQVHMGNVTATRTDAADRDAPARLDAKGGANVLDLSDRLDTKPYLSAHSDIVALMVLEHQTQMHNVLTHANDQARLALHQQEAMNTSFREPAGTISDGTRRRIESAAEKVVRHLLFVDEVLLTDPIAGSSSFAEDFAKLGPRDAKGRSLREFDLKTRMFKYPCSYQIYSRSFDALPAMAKAYISRRLSAILAGDDTSKEFSHLSREDRAAILEILRDTKPGLLVPAR